MHRDDRKQILKAHFLETSALPDQINGVPLCNHAAEGSHHYITKMKTLCSVTLLEQQS